jgi:hypothetical protein
MSIYSSKNLTSLSVNNSEKLRITSDGNVGIGTTNPNAKLDVRGIVKIGGSSAYPQSLQVFGYNDLSSTSVNTNPSTTHDGGGGIRIVNNNNTGNYGIGVYFDHGSLSSAILSSRVVTNNWGTDLRFYTHPINVQNQFLTFERMRINSEGNIGIGTTNPQSKLHVIGSIKVESGIFGETKVSGTGYTANTNLDITGFGYGNYFVNIRTTGVFHWNGILAVTMFDTADFGVSTLVSGNYSTTITASMVNLSAGNGTLRLIFNRNFDSISVSITRVG